MFSFFFPKDSYLGALRLFLRVQAAASASPLIFRRRLGYVRWISISRDPRGAQDFDWVALPGSIFFSRNSIAPTRPRFDFIYTKSSGRRGLSFRYTKNVLRRRLDFIYTRNAARRRLNFIYTKNWVGKMMEKQWFIEKIFRAARAHFLKNFFVSCVMGGRSDQKLQFSKWKRGFAMEQKFSISVTN